MYYIFSYLLVLLPFAAIDSIWLFSMGGFYKKWLGHLFSPTVSFTPVLIFYPLYVLGLYYLVVQPSVVLFASGASITFASVLKVLLKGAVFGLVAYATYDLTNQATLTNWPVLVTLVDLLWGTVLTGLSAALGYILILSFLHK